MERTPEPEPEPGLRGINELLLKLHNLMAEYTPIPPTSHSKDASMWKRMWHKGSLWAHTLWVARAASLEFEGGIPSPSSEGNQMPRWREGLPDSDYALLVHAAALHDLGKAGDGVTKYFRKENHEQIGVDYLLGKRVFHTLDGGTFDCRSLLDVGKWSDCDRATIRFLVGSHGCFGTIVGDLSPKKREDAKRVEEAFEELYDTLESIAKDAGIGAGAWNADLPRLLRLSCAINAADMMGIEPTTCGRPELSAGSVPEEQRVDCPWILSLWQSLHYGECLPLRAAFIDWATSAERVD